MRELLGALGLVLREALCRNPVPRTPEPNPIMDDAHHVAAFDAAAEVLLPVYHLSARAIGRLLPRSGTLLDLGCGSGRFLAHLAQVRPDVRIVGIDLSKVMVETGRTALAASGLGDRVELHIGDMTDLRPFAGLRPDVVSSVFSLHHLPDDDALRRCLAEIDRVRGSGGAWIFDHARPRSRATAERFPHVFTPRLDETFRRDSTSSLLASWEFERLSEELGDDWRHLRARRLRLYQAHWAGPTHDTVDPAEANNLPAARARRAHRRLSALFRDLDLLRTAARTRRLH